ncbi:hypothetical protein [uncultured Corynebacterium sp.]|uniref:hypothetical protein n=1 Tax=uncultured Corynebacterium sp. TaxID=159447 RepID=UPI0025F8580C|nr:hypothetical protein [uncultured Corynebacterium sp.]
MANNSDIEFTDVQRREVVTELITKDGIATLAVEKNVPGGSTKRLLLLNKYDAQKLKEALEHYLKTVYSNELAGIEGTLSPADMVELFGEDA